MSARASSMGTFPASVVWVGLVNTDSTVAPTA